MEKEVKCDFIVWTQKDLVILRILLDEPFVEGTLVELQHFVITAVLPEMIGKWYSRKPIADENGIVSEPANPNTSKSTFQDEDDEDYTKLWCYCDKPSYGDMVSCDNKACTIQWFHFDCLSLRAPPKGKWYCPSCRKLPKFNRKRNVPKIVLLNNKMINFILGVQWGDKG